MRFILGAPTRDAVCIERAQRLKLFFKTDSHLKHFLFLLYAAGVPHSFPGVMSCKRQRDERRLLPVDRGQRTGDAWTHLRLRLPPLGHRARPRDDWRDVEAQKEAFSTKTRRWRRDSTEASSSFQEYFLLSDGFLSRDTYTWALRSPRAPPRRRPRSTRDACRTRPCPHCTICPHCTMCPHYTTCVTSWGWRLTFNM